MTGETSDVALVVTTLVLATSFTPIKRRLEAFVKRRFRISEPTPASPAATDMGTGAGPPLDGATTSRLAAAVLADPAFMAVLDERIRAAGLQPAGLTGDTPGSGPERGSSA